MAEKILGDDPIDLAEMKKFQEACQRVVNGSRVDRAAAMAYIMSMSAQVTTQALIDLLKQKGLASEGDIRRAIANGYKEQHDRLSGEQGVILTPGPAVRKPS